jgi:hypothetical protein
VLTGGNVEMIQEFWSATTIRSAIRKAFTDHNMPSSCGNAVFRSTASPMPVSEVLPDFGAGM